MSIKKKIHYAVCLGCFICGIIMCYFSSINDHAEFRRVVIAGGFLGIAYMMFPLVDWDKKDKWLMSFALNFGAFVLALIFGGKSLIYFFNNRSSSLGYDLLATLGILILSTDVAYIAISFIASFFSIGKRVVGKIMQIDVKGKFMTLKNVLAATTAFIATVTALFAGVAALVKAVMKL